MRSALGIVVVAVSLAVGPAHAQNWPSFRGPNAGGVADAANPPTVFDVAKGVNVKWQTDIPGFAHSSPIVWGNQVFVTTAVPKGDAALTFKHGEGAGVASTTDEAVHSWRVYAVDKRSGKILWERVAHEGVPRTARHVMASQANSTPATDGTHLVVFFASEGLYVYDLAGKLLWKKDLGEMPAARVQDPTYVWNGASSPIIYKNRVIVQVDMLENSFIAAFDIDTGKEAWRIARDEIPSWATPFIYSDPSRHPARHRRRQLRARLRSGHGQGAVEAGQAFGLSRAHADRGQRSHHHHERQRQHHPADLRHPSTARGDITLKGDQESSEHVAWSKRRGGSFILTPIIHDDLLYVCSDTGILTAYKLATGEQVYRERLSKGGSFSASPVLANGKLYLADEEGKVTVVKAGPTFERLSENPAGELIMATPAISDNMLILRTQHRLLAIAESNGAVTLDGVNPDLSPWHGRS